MTRPARMLWLLGLLVVPAPLAGQEADQLPTLRARFPAAIERESAIAPALSAADAAAAQPGDEARAALISAYRGALIGLRGKHATWPPTRLRHLREGMRLLDGAVRAEPDHAEIRYLRLLSCYYLPAFLGRRGSVREDFAALVRILPEAGGTLPDDLYRSALRFVLDHGEATAAQRATLEERLRATNG